MAVSHTRSLPPNRHRPRSVEVAFAEQVGIRDSKNPDPSLTFPVESFRSFLSVVRTTGTVRP